MTNLPCFGVMSDFSLGESLLRLTDIPVIAKEFGYSAVAVADTMSVTSMVSLSKASKEAGIKPIIGAKIRVYDDSMDKTPVKKRERENLWFVVNVYAMDQAGVNSLFRLLSLANQDDHFYYVPRVSFSELESALSTSLAIHSGDFWSVFHHPEHEDYIRRMGAACTRSHTFLALSPLDTPLFDTLNEKAIRLHREEGYPLLLSRPAFYKDASQRSALAVMSAIARNSKMSDPWRPHQQIEDLSLCSPADLLRHAASAKERLEQRLGKGWCGTAWADAVEGSRSLVNACTYEWKRSSVSMPVMAKDEDAELVAWVKRGFAERLVKNQFMGHKPKDLEVYKERLQYELKVLRDMDFVRYFLLVADITRWSKKNGIMVGPGRGSVGGSLVAFLMGITDVDPIRFNLLFERFINPERLDLPDADLDFMSSRRHEVIDYLVSKYGKDNVSGISNYTTLGPAGAIRDVSRVFELHPGQYSCSKLVPHDAVDLEEAAGRVPEIEKFKFDQPMIWGIASALDGGMRSFGRHAAGIVVAGEPLVNRGVLERRSGEQAINWDKRIVEDQGLVKMDILGLSTLDVLRLAQEKIVKNHGVDFSYQDIDLEDEKVLEAFGAGDTIGVFQFESPGMRKLLKDLAQGGKLSFDDIAAATALYRPGPMESGLMDDYVATKQGVRLGALEHPNMKEALKNTYGVIVYQEQVMQIAQDLAGFTMADADYLRKAMGKKDPELMAKQREKWVEGCKAHSGMIERSAELLFDKIDKFAGYAFNRSHAVEYSIISYWTMWVKVYYPEEFYAATLSIMKTDKLQGIAENAARRGIHVVSPDIRYSTDTFEVSYDPVRSQKVLVAPFSAVKGLSDKTCQAIIKAREKMGEFKRFIDFFDSVSKRACNIRQIYVLDKIGAFADLEFGAEEEKRAEKEFPEIALKQIDRRHPDRLRDKIELLPGLVLDVLKADRKIPTDKFVKAKLIETINQWRECDRCDLKDCVHPTPRLGGSAKIMVITDYPNWSEEKAGKMLEGEGSSYVKNAMDANGILPKDCYFTSLVKAPKSDKQLTNEQINGCSPWLDKEIELLKPPIILALGGSTIRHLVPGVKGGFEELCGQVHFLPALEASVIFGINPMMVYVDSARQKMLDAVFAKAAAMVN